VRRWACGNPGSNKRWKGHLRRIADTETTFSNSHNGLLPTVVTNAPLQRSCNSGALDSVDFTQVA
jgi:hypothetical protein